MSTVNVMAREIAARIVFYGPGLAGKTTSLKRANDAAFALYVLMQAFTRLATAGLPHQDG